MPLPWALLAAIVLSVIPNTFLYIPIATVARLSLLRFQAHGLLKAASLTM
ncbi:hypothetical protein D9611_008956 [Ephemerocybe angulata]|uniref:Uncharacterized protein n=1 Tax=Ephemerocybe angulata TaxID=980116 RepID=A0A8H5BZ44_9AGAR|nr:hypothetical protein D9611_008956 [Tulosesus angulatus]